MSVETLETVGETRKAKTRNSTKYKISSQIGHTVLIYFK